VAVKALKPDFVRRSPEIVARFEREGETLRQLNHPNIVHRITALEEDGEYFLVMEYIAGGSLGDLLAKQGRLPVERVLKIALELSDALTRAHELGIIHRDLKPANILLDEEGTPHLTDFGIAHVGASSRITEAGVLLGTIDYLSPEICQGQPVDRRADIWAFGVLLYEMLAGAPPFSGETPMAKITAILTQPTRRLAARRIP
jgi:serine/threonine-protein kinase